MWKLVWGRELIRPDWSYWNDTTMEVIWLIDHAGINGNHCRTHRIVRQFLDPDSMRWQMFSTSANCTGRTSSSQLPPTDTPKTNGCMETPAMAIGPIRDLRTWNNGMPQRPVVLCLVIPSQAGIALRAWKNWGVGATWISTGEVGLQGIRPNGGHDVGPRLWLAL